MFVTRNWFNDIIPYTAYTIQNNTEENTSKGYKEALHVDIP